MGIFVGHFLGISTGRSQVGTYNGVQAVTTRIRSVTDSTFHIAMQEDEGNDQVHATETLFYVAWEAGTGVANGLEYDSGRMTTTDVFTWLPQFGLQLKLEEERALDSEVTHTQETVGYLVAGQGESHFILAEAQTANGSDTASLRFRESPIEAQRVTLDHNWSTVNFHQSFSQPVVLAKPLSSYGGDPSVVRMRNVTSSGAEIHIQEWDYLDGAHTVEELSILTLETGHSRLPDGTLIEAGSFNLANAGSGTFVSIPFMMPFSVSPVVMVSIPTSNDNQPVGVRLTNVTRTGFWIRLSEEEASDQLHGMETVSFLAIEPTSNVLAGMQMQVGRAEEVNHKGKTVPFDSPFATIPCVVAEIPDFLTSRIHSDTNS